MGTFQKVFEDYGADYTATMSRFMGNMGLTPLYNAVCGIVEPLRAGEVRNDYRTLYQNIQIEYQKAEALRDTLRGANNHG